jgi:hypothetical protein
MARLRFYFGQMIVLNELITFCPVCDSSFSGTLQISKSFKLPIFWLLDSAFGLRGLLKWKCTFFSWEMNHHIVTCYAYKTDAAEHVSSHRFSLLPSHIFCYFQSFLATCCISSHSALHGQGTFS